MTRSRAFVKQKALFRTLIVRLHKLAGFCKHFQVNNQNGNLIEDNGPDADSLSTMLMITLMLICYEQIVNLFDQDTVYDSCDENKTKDDDNSGTANDNDVVSSADDFWLWKPGGLWKAQ